MSITSNYIIFFSQSGKKRFQNMHSISAGLLKEQDGSRMRSQNRGALEAEALLGCDGCHCTLLAVSTRLSLHCCSRASCQCPRFCEFAHILKCLPALILWFWFLHHRPSDREDRNVLESRPLIITIILAILYLFSLDSEMLKPSYDISKQMVQR